MAVGLGAPSRSFAAGSGGGGGGGGAGRRKKKVFLHSVPTRCLIQCRTREPATKVYAVSDLHTDYSENMAWVRGLSIDSYASSALIVAGDVAETRENFAATMKLLKDRFRRVFFVPGNHDLWLRKEKGLFLHSLEKLNALLDVCRELGVETSPAVVGDVGIIPLYSWYHQSFDKEKDVSGIRIPSIDTVCKDFYACKWRQELSPKDTSLAICFDSMNEVHRDSIEQIQQNALHIITFSHFVPRQDLCPEKRMLFYPNLPKIIGSDLLEERLRLIHGANGQPSACHVFGHTHFSWDVELDGIRYVQAPLAYPRERKRRMNGGAEWLPFCIYDGALTARLTSCRWSEYYTLNKRDPNNIDLAPWVARFYQQQR
ncbi:uncharacterized protein LOC144699909 [Wolffia australiana]